MIIGTITNVVNEMLDKIAYAIVPIEDMYFDFTEDEI